MGGYKSWSNIAGVEKLRANDKRCITDVIVKDTVSGREAHVLHRPWPITVLRESSAMYLITGDLYSSYYHSNDEIFPETLYVLLIAEGGRIIETITPGVVEKRFVANVSSQTVTVQIVDSPQISEIAKVYAEGTVAARDSYTVQLTIDSDGIKEAEREE